MPFLADLMTLTSPASDPFSAASASAAASDWKQETMIWKNKTNNYFPDNLPLCFGFILSFAHAEYVNLPQPTTGIEIFYSTHCSAVQSMHRPWAAENWSLKDQGKNGIWGQKDVILQGLLTKKIVLVLVDEYPKKILFNLRRSKKGIKTVAHMYLSCENGATQGLLFQIIFYKTCSSMKFPAVNN